MRSRAFGMFSLIAIAIAFVASADEPKWTEANESALRNLIAKEHVVLELYSSKRSFNGVETSLPLQRLRVPQRFVEIYRTDPIECLTVLVDIIENGTADEAMVAFQFGYAGDEPQTAIPPFVHFPPKDLDRPNGDRGTHRQWCLRIIKNVLEDKKHDDRPLLPRNKSN